MDVQASKAMFLGNGDIHEEFEEDDDYVGFVNKNPLSILSCCSGLSQGLYAHFAS